VAVTRISEAYIEELLARVNIEDVVSSYVNLTKRTGANRFGLCPFHGEKTPSFSVNPDRQMFYCFGCHKGGGAVNFIMEIENLPYPDAVVFLAKKAGMRPPDTGESRESASRRNRILELNRDAARYYRDALFGDKGRAALGYMARRKIGKPVSTRFGLGAAPDEWSALTDAMQSKGYKKTELLEAGLAKSGKNGSVYDTFRDRLLFPVIDVRGSVIGFSGRALGDGEPKYLNSPDTPVFSKSRNLFALNLAKKSKAGKLLLVEGNVDVVSLHQAGIDYAVASLGTALTEGQARLMKRFSSEVLLCYDGDEAGLRATERAIGILELAGLNVRVLRMKDAKDPDEFIVKFGADAFAALLDGSENRVDYRLRELYAKSAPGTDEGRLAFVKGAVSLLCDLNSPAERELYGRKAAEKAGISYESVESEIARELKSRSRRETAKIRREEVQVRRSVQPRDRAVRYENEVSAVAEQGVIRCILFDPETIGEARKLGLAAEEFTSPLLGAVYERLLAQDEAERRINLNVIIARFTPGEASEIMRVVSDPFRPEDAAAALRDCAEKIRAEKANRSGGAEERALAVWRQKQKGVGEK
jgi:DNA primase